MKTKKRQYLVLIIVSTILLLSAIVAGAIYYFSNCGVDFQFEVDKMTLIKKDDSSLRVYITANIDIKNEKFGSNFEGSAWVEDDNGVKLWEKNLEIEANKNLKDPIYIRDTKELTFPLYFKVMRNTQNEEVVVYTEELKDNFKIFNAEDLTYDDIFEIEIIKEPEDIITFEKGIATLNFTYKVKNISDDIFFEDIHIGHDLVNESYLDYSSDGFYMNAIASRELDLLMPGEEKTVEFSDEIKSENFIVKDLVPADSIKSVDYYGEVTNKNEKFYVEIYVESRFITNQLDAFLTDSFKFSGF